MLDILTDLLFPEQYHNNSGIYQVHYLPLEWVSSITLDGGVGASVSLVAGKAWKLLESTRMTQGLTITAEEDDNGDFFRSLIPGHLPNKTSAITLQLNLLQKLKLIVKATDNDGNVRLIGNQSEYAELKLKEFTTKGNPGTREGYSWEIRCVNSAMPPILS